MDTLFMYLIPAVIVVFAFVTIGLIFAKLYERTTKEQSFVRTGFGGEKIVVNGGALVLPILHDKIYVNMKTLKLIVCREARESLITKDRMRVDITAEFYLRVKPDADSISKAAQTLGSKTLDTKALAELIEGKFVDGLRSVAASMIMEDLHEKRVDFVQQVQNNVAEDLLKNGLELESVSLTSLNQTLKEYFDPQNAFDAQGLAVLTQITKAKEQERNEIEQNTNLAIQQKNLETTKKSLDLSQQEAIANAEQKKKIAESEATQISQMQIIQINKDQESQQAKILADENIQKANIEKDKSIKIAEQNTKIEIAKKSEEELAAQASANEAKAKEIETAEKIITAKETEIAEREKSLAIIRANQEAEKKSIEIVVASEAVKNAAINESEAVKVKAQGQAEAIRIESEAKEKMYAVDAEGKSKLNEAENLLSKEIIEMRIKEAIIANLPAIVAQVVKPMENIESIRIVDMGGSVDRLSNAQGSSIQNGGSLSDQLVNASLKHKMCSPLVQEIMNSVGLNLDSVSGLTAPLSEMTSFTAVPQVTPVEEIKPTEE